MTASSPPDSALPPEAAVDAPAIALDRNSPLPLYAQVQRRIRAMITGRAQLGESFYSDQELCAMFGISRFTARQAVQELVNEGLLRRVQGQGTFINTQKSEEVFGPRMDLPIQWARVGRPLSFDIERFAIEPGPAEMSALLLVAAERPLLVVERLRRNGPQIVSYDYRYIHPDFAEGLTVEAVRHESLLKLISGHVRLARADNRVEAVIATADIAKRLGIARGSAVLVREMLYVSADGLPVMAGRSLHPGDRIRHVFSIALESDNEFGVTQWIAPDDAAQDPTAD